MRSIASYIRGKAHYGLLAALAILLMTRAVLAPPMTHDSFWIDSVWSEQFTALLRTGNLYPRWLPWSYGGLGSPAFYFYAPLSFHLAGLFGLLGLPTYAALLAAFGAAWFGSGVTMHMWLKDRASAPLVGAVLYMILPYHVIDFYGRGALAEFCAFAIVPLVAIGVRQAVERGRAIPLAAAYAALIMTHLPTAVIVSVLLIAPQSIWFARREPRRLWAVVRGAIGGIAAAALYLVPALTLQSYSSISALWSVKSLRPVSWSLLHPELWTSKSYVMLFSGLALAVAVAALIVSLRRWSFWSAWTIGICIIIVGLLPGFWSLPVLSSVQFPWRCLVLAEFGLATVMANHRGSPVVATVAVLPLLSFALLMLTPANPMHREPMRALPVPGRQDVIEYLPPGAVGPYRTPRADRIERAVAAARAHPGSVFPFPSQRARCADKLASLIPDSGGALIASPPAGCQVTIERLPAEKIGLAISVVAWLGLALSGSMFTIRAGSWLRPSNDIAMTERAR